ncbi:MAG TPA: 3-ketoacyl-ACP reductase [Candidatus Paceibacterota bacterium]|nr:3-ketoacyl-ACP reductase [Verrucomicrobiota bacterium]HRY46589.1 3-ketoacyl-ACP reductase [Candidatus Paceibacterota bacterium]
MNPTALITGGSRGIGRGIALELARIGWSLVVNYAGNRSAAEETARACVEAARSSGQDIRVEICQGDIALAEDRRRLIEFGRERWSRLDLLVNNAGVAPVVRADLLEADEASFDRLIGINVKGPFFLTQQVARWMVDQVQAGAPDYHPKIITVTSISAYTASVNRGDYCVSKAALSMLTPLYAARLAEYGIRVYELRPGIIATDMTHAVKEKYDRLIAEGLTPLPRWGEPADVGKAVVAIAQDLLPFSTGEVINVDGGFHLRRL